MVIKQGLYRVFKWSIFSLVIFLCTASIAFSAQPGFKHDWSAITWTGNAGVPYTGIEHWVVIIDHDGIANNGSSHSVTVTYPDSTTRRLNFRYKQDDGTAVYEFWDDINPTNNPGIYSGDYVYRITDTTTGEWSEMIDHVIVNPVDPLDETSFSPGFGAPTSMEATFDDVYVNGILYDDFYSGFDGSKWESLPSEIVNNTTQRVAPGSITIDGDGSDWAGLTPALYDPQGDSVGGTGTDIKYVYTAMDTTHAYVMVETYNSIDPDDILEINFDYKPWQHYTHDVRADLHTNIGDTWLSAGNDNELDGISESLPITGYTVVRGNVMEAKIPLSEIENAAYFNPTYVNIWTGDQRNDPSHIGSSIKDKARFEYAWDTANGRSSGMDLKNPETVNELKATVRINSSTGNDPYARIGGTFCNDGIGDITARLGIRGSEAICVVFREYMDGNIDMKPQVLPFKTLGPLTPGNRYELTLGWDGSRFTFRVQGIDDTILYTDNYSPSGTITNTAIPKRFIGLSSWPFLDTTTPTFNWNEVKGATYYRVRLYTLNNNTLFRGHTKTPPYRLPPGILKPNAVYKYRIEAINEHQWFEADNVAASNRDIARFITGPTEAQSPWIDLNSLGVYTWNAAPLADIFTNFYVRIHDAQGVPGNIASVKALFPDGSTTTDLYYDYNETPTQTVYWGRYLGAVQPGDYQITATDKDLNSHTITETLTPDPIGYPSESSLLPLNNTLVGDTQVSFDWEDVPDAAFYQLNLYDKNLNYLFDITTTESEYQLPPGLLKEESYYRYRVRTKREFVEDNQDNASASPILADWDSNTFFTTAKHGTNLPEMDIDRYGVALEQGPHPSTGMPVYNLIFSAMVTDLDGTPENIQKVEVTYPDGITKCILKYLDDPARGRNYYAEKRYPDPLLIQDSSNSSGIYTFQVTDFDNNTITMFDTLPKAVGTGGNVLPIPSNATPAHGSVLDTMTPLISWDSVPGASYYRVRILNAIGWTTLHWSDEQVQNRYKVPCGVLEPGTTYAYKVYAYREPVGSEVDFYSINTLWGADSNRFTTGKVPEGANIDVDGCFIIKGDLNRDGSIDLEDSVLGLKVITSQQNSADSSVEVDGDGKIGLKDTIKILQSISGIRSDNIGGYIGAITSNNPDEQLIYDILNNLKNYISTNQWDKWLALYSDDAILTVGYPTNSEVTKEEMRTIVQGSTFVISEMRLLGKKIGTDNTSISVEFIANGKEKHFETYTFKKMEGNWLIIKESNP